MAEYRTFWLRVRSALDALSLGHVLICTLVFVVWRGSPVFALGGAFATPIVLAALVAIGRRLHFALTGRLPGAPPVRLGLPLSERRHNGALQQTVASSRWVG
jgi:peptidoglycan/LPS O-acetylase OafA/YrhL